MIEDPTFTAERSWLEDMTPAIAVKISAPSYEVNVGLRLEEVGLLPAILSTSWKTGAKPVGRSAGAHVFWSCDDGMVSLGIGHDDQTWDVGISFSAEAFHRMLAAIQHEIGAHRS